MAGKDKYKCVLGNFATVHSTGPAFYTDAYSMFERSLRLYLYLLDNDGDEPPGGVAGMVDNLPDLEQHVVKAFPTLYIPVLSHPNAIFSPTVKASNAELRIGGGSTRLDNVLVETGGVPYYAQLLLLFRAEHGGTIDCAFIWWYNETGEDATRCALLSRAYTRVRGVRERAPWTQVVSIDQVQCRVHLIPRRDSETWALSTHDFRDNKYMFSLPHSKGANFQA